MQNATSQITAPSNRPHQHQFPSKKKRGWGPYQVISQKLTPINKCDATKKKKKKEKIYMAFKKSNHHYQKKLAFSATNNNEINQT